MRYGLLLFLFLGQTMLNGQAGAIAFWNVENLYDTIDDPLTDDAEFTPAGKNAWSYYRYINKLARVSEVLQKMDAETGGIFMVGLCEVENKAVLQDLVRSPALKEKKYDIVHYDSPDLRGIDVALLYRPDRFTVLASRSVAVPLPDTSRRTRDILLVSGMLLGEKIHVLVNHWPSRRGGEAASRPLRIAAAKVANEIADSLCKDSGARVLLMGDFNDDPDSYSMRSLIKGCEGCMGFHNPMTPLLNKGIGSLAWNDRWNLFDQLIVSHNWLKGPGLIMRGAHVFNRDFLRTREGNYRGYPYRTYSAGVYTAGYSDHFPSYLLIEKSNKP